MAIYKRWKGRTITADHPYWKQAHWSVEFWLRGKRVFKAIPEARTQAQAERVEIRMKEDIYNRKYGNGKAVGLANFFESSYLAWLKDEHPSSHRDAVSRGKLVKDFFGDQPLQDIAPQDVRRFKTSLKNGTTPRGLLRSGATVNRYIYLLSAICALAIEEEIMTSNPCAKIVDEPEKARERYLTSDEETRLAQTMTDDLAFLRLPFEVSLNTGVRKNIELLKLKVEHLNFSSRPVFFPVHGGSVEIPSNWLIVVKGKRGKYRLIPMNSRARPILYQAVKSRGLDDLVFDKDANGVNEYMLRWGFETACKRGGIPFGETTPGGIIWHDLRRTFATRLRARGVHEYDIQDLLGHSKPGVTTIYARATHATLERAVEKLIEPTGQVVEFERKAG